MARYRELDDERQKAQEYADAVSRGHLEFNTTIRTSLARDVAAGFGVEWRSFVSAQVVHEAASWSIAFPELVRKLNGVAYIHGLGTWVKHLPGNQGCFVSLSRPGLFKSTPVLLFSYGAGVLSSPEQVYKDGQAEVSVVCGLLYRRYYDGSDYDGAEPGWAWDYLSEPTKANQITPSKSVSLTGLVSLATRSSLEQAVASGQFEKLKGLLKTR